MKKYDYKFKIGDKLFFNSWKALLDMAFKLSAEGYGVSTIGFDNMSNNMLTITALPEKGDAE